MGGARSLCSNLHAQEQRFVHNPEAAKDATSRGAILQTECQLKAARAVLGVFKGMGREKRHGQDPPPRVSRGCASAAMGGKDLHATYLSWPVTLKNTCQDKHMITEKFLAVRVR